MLARTAGSGSRAVDVGALAALDVAGRAVLLHTGGDAAWGHADYATEAPYLTEAGARWLAERGARLVGIDSVNIDDIQGGGRRPAHTILLRAGIPVVEHLTGLSQLPRPGSGSPRLRFRSQASGPSPPVPTRRYPSHDLPGRCHQPSAVCTHITTDQARSRSGPAAGPSHRQPFSLPACRSRRRLALRALRPAPAR